MKEINLSQDKVAIVDDEDFEYLNQWKWHAFKSKKTWYAIRSFGEKPNRHSVCMHRMVAQRAGMPFSKQYDHCDNNGLNNRRNNLRPATGIQNAAHRRKGAGCSSRFKGVVWNKNEGRWKACVGFNYEHINLGTFTDEVEAAKVVDFASRFYFGPFAELNFPSKFPIFPQTVRSIALGF